MTVKEHIDKQDIINGVMKLGLTGQRAVIHSSLKSFGRVDGGPDTVIEAFKESFKTFLMPAFCWDSNTAPPLNDRPRQNGCDYSYYDNWQKPMVPFKVESAGIEKSMGAIPRRFISLPGTFRSDHAWHSWAASGDKAQELTANHDWSVANLPLERLAELDSWIVLVGVSLQSCTALHISEERIGRRPFIRWAVDRSGKVRRVRAAGCGKGFGNLVPFLNDLFRTVNIGNSRIMAAPLSQVIDTSAKIINDNPDVTRCSPDCIRCRDAILGGPIDDK